MVARNDVLLWFRETGGKLQRKRWHLLKRWGLCCFFQGEFSKSSVTWLPLYSARATALLTWPPTSLWLDGVGPSQSPPERLHSADHSSAALLSLRVICLQLWLILVGWDVSHLLSREGAQVITKHSHSWDHHAKMHLLKLAPGKHGHSREETRLSGSRAHREDHAEPTASERSSPVHGEGNRRQFHYPSASLLTASSLLAVLWGHDCSLLALFSTSQNKKNLKYWSWRTFLSKFHKPMWGFLYLKYDRLLLSEGNLRNRILINPAMFQMQSGAEWECHFLFGAFISMPWPLQAVHPSLGRALWTWGLMKAWGHGILSIQIQAHTSHLGARGGCGKLGCLPYHSGLWGWEQRPFLASAASSFLPAFFFPNMWSLY